MPGAFATTEDLLAIMAANEAEANRPMDPEGYLYTAPEQADPEALYNLGDAATGFAYNMHPAVAATHATQAVGDGRFADAAIESMGFLPFLGPALKGAGQAIRGAFAARPVSSTAGLSAGTLVADTTAAGDGSDRTTPSFSERVGNLRTRRETLFNELNSLQKDLQAVGERKRAEIMKKPARELQRLVGAEVDGVIGGKTQAAIDDYISKEVEAASRAAQDRFNALQGEMSALDQQIQYEIDTNSPEAIQKRLRETPTRELYPNFARDAVALGGGAGFTIGMLARGRGLMDYNRALATLGDDAARTSKEAVDAYRAGRFADASEGYSAARALQGQLDDVAKKGPKHKWTPVVTTVTGAELGAHSPALLDYFNSSGNRGDPLYDSFIDQMAGGANFPGENFLKRTAGTAIPAALAGKLGSALATPLQRAKPPGAQTNLQVFDDITTGDVAKRAGQMATEAGRTFQAEARGLNHLSKRRDALADADQRAQLADLRRQAEMKLARGERLAAHEKRALGDQPEPPVVAPPGPQGQKGLPPPGESSGSSSSAPSGNQAKGGSAGGPVQGKIEVTKEDVDKATANLARYLGVKPNAELRKQVEKSLPTRWIDEAHKKSVLGGIAATIGGAAAGSTVLDDIISDLSAGNAPRGGKKQTPSYSDVIKSMGGK